MRVLIFSLFLLIQFHFMFILLVDLFEGLVPVPVSQALAAYEIRKTELVNHEISSLRGCTQFLNTLVSYLFFLMFVGRCINSKHRTILIIIFKHAF